LQIAHPHYHFPVPKLMAIRRITEVSVSPDDCALKIVTYDRLFAFGRPQVFVYSTFNIEETLLRLWNHYTEHRYAHRA